MKKLIPALSAWNFWGATLLTIVIAQTEAQASSMATNLSDLTETEIRTNLTNVRNNNGDVAAHDDYAGVLHTSSEWNHLGRSNTADDGVRWSVNGGAFGTEDIHVDGEFSIVFEFTLWSAGYGLHAYDQVKAWVYWNNNNSFAKDNKKLPSSNEYAANETVLAAEYVKNDSNPFDQVMSDPNTKNKKVAQNLKADTMTTFITDAFEVSDAMLDSLTDGGFGGFWLRARSQCNHVTFNNMDPYSLLAQGEAEDHFISITRNPVPEPTTMLLFGAGLAGLAGVRRRTKR